MPRRKLLSVTRLIDAQAAADGDVPTDIRFTNTEAAADICLQTWLKRMTDVDVPTDIHLKNADVSFQTWQMTNAELTAHIRLKKYTEAPMNNDTSNIIFAMVCLSFISYLLVMSETLLLIPYSEPAAYSPPLHLSIPFLLPPCR